MKRAPWPTVTIVLMLVGYAGYYLCRSHFSVARPLILAENASIGITKESLGAIAAWGTGFYALGKFLFGSFADIVGGRRMFLLGMGGAIVCTILFMLGGPPLFLAAWIGNRFLQSSGWVGMCSMTGKWFSYDRYGRVMAWISLSYLFGDFLSRLFLSELIGRGMTWQQTFAVAAAVLAVIFIPTAILLRERATDRGLPAPTPDPGAAVSSDTPLRVADLLRPLLRNPTFWTVCVLSFGFTFMRETFNDWTPTYLTEVAQMKAEDAGRASSLFPLLGGISVILVGFMSDRFGSRGRAWLIAGGLAFGTVGLAILAQPSIALSTEARVTLVAAIGFVLIGPYSLLAGAISLAFGGDRASAAAAGWIDGVGYVGGILSGYLIGKVAQNQGWAPAFMLLAVTAAVSLVVALSVAFRLPKAAQA